MVEMLDPSFKPVVINLVLTSQAEVDSIKAMTRYTVTIPELVRQFEGLDRPGEYIIQQFLLKLRNQLPF